MITRVTITGADDSIKPTDLIDLTEEFPFVEWGILVSKSRIGTPRYPSIKWINELVSLQRNDGRRMNLSCHLCGAYVRYFFEGNERVVDDLGHEIWHAFSRVQLNFHAIPYQQSLSLAVAIRRNSDKEFIFQYDAINGPIAEAIARLNCNVSILFDQSGGAGILPAQWPNPHPEMFCGYAGGLSPENVSKEIDKIKEKVGIYRIWIDVETHVRSNNDEQFDLNKVKLFLETCRLKMKW